MNYPETCEYLYHQMPMFERQGASGYKEGLSNTLALDEHFNHPHHHFATIHIGGTNGKGSVSAMLECSGGATHRMRNFYATAMMKFIGNTKKILRSYADPMPF